MFWTRANSKNFYKIVKSALLRRVNIRIIIVMPQFVIIAPICNSCPNL